MFLWTQRTCAVQDLATEMNRLELDGWEIFQIFPGPHPTIVASRSAESEEVEEAIRAAPPATPLSAAAPGAAPDPNVKVVTEYGDRVRIASDQPWWQEAREMARTKKIQAIKLVRSRTGLGLKDAKSLVEQHIMTDDVPSSTSQASWRAEALHLLRTGRKIQAIKLVRSHNSQMGLKEAKAFVEAME